MDDKALEDLLDSTLSEFTDENTVSSCPCDAMRMNLVRQENKNDASSQDASKQHPAQGSEEYKQAIRAEVCGKFTALMSIFLSDVRLDEDMLKEFQGMADKQLELLQRACEDGKCTTQNFQQRNDDSAEDALSSAVKETVELLKSGSSGSAEMNEQEILQKFTEQLQGFDNDPNMQGMMEGMMQQLLSKEFLYEPLQEIAAKYPDWLAKNKGVISTEVLAMLGQMVLTLSWQEYDKYSEQFGIIQEICRCYETEADNVEKIVELMQKMQKCGQPPSEIVKEIGGDLELDENGLPRGLAGQQGWRRRTLGWKDLEAAVVEEVEAVGYGRQRLGMTFAGHNLKKRFTCSRSSTTAGTLLLRMPDQEIRQPSLPSELLVLRHLRGVSRGMGGEGWEDGRIAWKRARALSLSRARSRHRPRRNDSSAPLQLAVSVDQRRRGG
eukprot:437177-Hanusia_phi.AAC.1